MKCYAAKPSLVCLSLTRPACVDRQPLHSPSGNCRAFHPVTGNGVTWYAVIRNDDDEWWLMVVVMTYHRHEFFPHATRLGRQMQVWLIPIADERVVVQVKLWVPLRTRRAIPERFCGSDSLRRGAISGVCTFTFYTLGVLSRNLRTLRTSAPTWSRHCLSAQFWHTVENTRYWLASRRLFNNLQLFHIGGSRECHKQSAALGQPAQDIDFRQTFTGSKFIANNLSSATDCR